MFFSVTTIGDLDTVASKLSRTGLQYRANEVLTTPDREEPLAMCEASSTGDNSARKEARIGNEVQLFSSDVFIN